MFKQGAPHYGTTSLSRPILCLRGDASITGATSAHEHRSDALLCTHHSPTLLNFFVRVVRTARTRSKTTLTHHSARGSSHPGTVCMNTICCSGSTCRGER